MPIYEYHCENCGSEFEELVSSMNAPAPDCPQCQHKAQRKVSVFSAHSGSSSPCGDNAQSCCMNAKGSCPGSACPMSR